MIRATAAILVAALLALLAWRAGALSRSGTIAAAVVGAAALLAGWDWGALLLAFFITGSALSLWRREEKEARTGGIISKSGRRDAFQVIANGGVFGASAILFVLDGWAGWQAAATGAIAAATADTWSTEIGSLARAAPRSILSGEEVPAGTSGAVSAAGTAAMLGGAVFMAGLTVAVDWPAAAAVGALAGGVVGALADSVLGATVQSRRWCATCRTSTERHVHQCGSATRKAGGVEWLDNDWINLLCTTIGAGTGLAFAA